MKAGITGVTANTPEQLVFGAGTIHKGLKYENNAWNFDESIVGATAEGTKLNIVPEVTPITADGVHVAMKGMMRKTGETATLETKFIVVTPELLKATTLGRDGTPYGDGSSVIESKADIVDADYWENVAYVGTALDGEPVIAILDNALCKTGLNLETKDKENAAITATFECTAELGADGDTLPWRIIYPKRSA